MLTTRKVVSALLLAGLIGSNALVPTAQANKEPKRVVRQVSDDYQAPAPAFHPVHPAPPAVTLCNHGGMVDGRRGCVEFGVLPTEHFVAIEVVDASGTAAPFFIAEGDELQDQWEGFCGTTDGPHRIKAGMTITVFPYAYSPVGLGPCPGAATTGTVNATFSNVSGSGSLRARQAD